MKPKNITERLEQICSGLCKDGYRVTGSMPGIRALKHPNGNRFTILISGRNIHYLKNSRLVKSEPFESAISAR